MPIAFIVAAAGKKQVIGKDGDLPWHFSSDLKFFKDKTLGHTVLMGRITYDSILKRLKKPLPGRKTIVMTRDNNFTDDRVQIAHDLKTAITAFPKDQWLYVIGGASIFEQTLELADIVYLTHIDKEIEGDSWFPLLDPQRWQKTEEHDITESGTPLRFCTYKRSAT